MVAKRILVGVVVICWVASLGRAQTPIYSLPGEATGSLFGFACVGLGDGDGDGVRDFAIGVPGVGTGEVRVFSGRTGIERYRVLGNAAADLFGYAIDEVDDLDADGAADFVVGAPQLFAAPPTRGYARLISGRTGTTLTTISGDRDGGLFGFAVAAAGDVNRDGYRDVIIGGPNADGFAGYARVCSGRDGSPLRTWNGAAFEQFGFAVAAAGDIDADGYADVIVGGPGGVSNGGNAGTAVVYSGWSGAALLTLVGSAPSQFLGAAVAGIGDIDADGVTDLAIGGYGDASNGFGAGTAWIVSGRDGSRLHTFFGDRSGDAFGVDLRGIGDADGDGCTDLLVGTHAEYARLFSGSDGRVLFDLPNHRHGHDHWGFRLGTAGDIDDDRAIDFFVGAHTERNMGGAHLLSTRRLSLASDRHALPLTSGGEAGFALDAGPVHAGSAYVLLGSASGTRPGLTVGTSNLPLNVDGYFVALLGSPDTLVLGSVGTLDRTGRASARLVLPPLPAGLAGLTLHHAYAVAGPGPGITVFVLTSNAVPVTLVR